ncbi:MAG: hypothetical protein ACK5AY_02720 [Bacteroidota bacterium]|jgi:hypothetical protein
MKNKFSILFILIASCVFAQENQSFHHGIQLGLAGNKSHFSGGMSDADARFTHGAFGTVSLNWIARYDYNQFWKIESGIGFSNIGFEYSILENYNFLKRKKKNNFSKSSIGTIEIPVIVSYKFKPNCKNAKWFIGAGFANVFVGKDVKYEAPKTTEDLPVSISKIENSTSIESGLYLHPRVTFGREKLFNKGGMFSWAVLWNFGTGKLATSNVEYQINGIDYNHEFSNKGNFVGMRFAYFFKTKSKS